MTHTTSLDTRWQVRTCPTGIIAHEATINGRLCVIHQDEHEIHAMVRRGPSRFSVLTNQEYFTILYGDDDYMLSLAKKFYADTANDNHD